MGSSFDATVGGVSRATVVGWFVSSGWEAAEIASGNWVLRRDGNELVVSHRRRHGRPVAVRGLLAIVAVEGSRVCHVLDAAHHSYSAFWFNGTGAEFGAQIKDVMYEFNVPPFVPTDRPGTSN